MSTTAQRVLGDYCSQDDDIVTPLEGMDITSPETAQFGQHLMTEVEERTKHHFQSGWSILLLLIALCFLLSLSWLCSTLCLSWVFLCGVCV